MDRKEVREKFEEIERIDNINNKIVLINEILLKSDFVLNENYLMQFDDDRWDKEDNKFLKFLEYKKKNQDGFYEKYDDCDVSLVAMAIYQKVYKFLSGKNITPHANGGYGIKAEGDMVYRGDALTSAWTVFKKYLTFLWYEKNISSLYEELFVEFIDKKGRRTIAVPADKDKPSYSCLKDYVTDRGTDTQNKGFHNIIFNVISSDAKEFLNNYMTAGNYIAIPEHFNSERSNWGEWDTVDRMLWKLFQYYHYKDKDGDEEAKKYLKQMFNVKYEAKLAISVNNCLKWLEESGADSWDEFIKIHCLQDFVYETKEGEYGCPLSLKTGEPIKKEESIDCCIDDEYDPMPKNLEDCETFFKTANEKILARSKRICDKIRSQSN
jgi:hypothetical protein